MKTFEKCCDEVAIKNGFDTWRTYEGYLINHEPPHVRMHYLTKAAELYREEGIKEAVKLARERGYTTQYDHFPTRKYTESEILEKLKL